MISRTSRYALRILGFLVEHPGTRINGEQIAQATGIPANYLSKILNQMRKQGIVDSEKGWGGGFLLLPESERMTIGEVLQVVDGLPDANESACVFGLPECDADDPCPLHTYWERVRANLEEMLTTVEIRDLGRSDVRRIVEKRDEQLTK